MGLAHFDGPRLKVSRAREHFDALSRTISEYSTGLGARFEKIGDTAWTLGLSRSMPASVPLILGDLVHNLRSSLDIAMCDIAAIRNAEVEDVKFPFVKDEGAYQRLNPKNKKDGPFLALGQDVVDEVRKLRPWKIEHGGHPLLRPLHDLDLRDKHRLVLVLAEFVSVTTNIAPFALAMINKLIAEENPGMAPMESSTGLALGGIPKTIVPGERINMPAGVHPKDAYPLARGSIRIVFPAGGMFAGRSVLETCTECIQFIDETVELFARKFG